MLYLKRVDSFVAELQCPVNYAKSSQVAQTLSQFNDNSNLLGVGGGGWGGGGLS